MGELEGARPIAQRGAREIWRPRRLRRRAHSTLLRRPRTKKWENWKAPDPSLKEVREKFGGPGVSDEELILRFYAGHDAADEVLKAGAAQAKLDVNQPLTKP